MERGRSVWITGVGLWTALGDREQTWAAIQAGRSALVLRQPFGELPPRPLALVGDHPASLRDLWQPALGEALADAGLAWTFAEAERSPGATIRPTGAVIGSSRGAQGAIEAICRGDRPIAEFLACLPQAAAVEIAQALGLSGPVRSPMAACATGLWAIGQAVMAIQAGECDRVIAGAVEAPISPLTIAGFEQLGALAHDTCRPFDRDRSGLALGEGAALFVLEAAEVAQGRSRSTYASIAGLGWTADAYRVTAPEPSGQIARRAIEQAIGRAGWQVADVDYYHAHGTGTLLNDAREAELIRSIFGQTGEYGDRLRVSSTKGATGHTLGASGAIGLALTCLALRDQVLPPSIGLDHPVCPDVAWVRSARPTPGQELIAQEMNRAINRAIVVAFGFGGQNAAIAINRGNRHHPADRSH